MAHAIVIKEFKSLSGFDAENAGRTGEPNKNLKHDNS
jgi:hypothetical protein